MITTIPFPHLKFQFLQIECKPEALALFDQLPEKGLAIVGTRYPQKRSFEIVEKTVNELKDSGLVIVSGFARGIDSKAHELALENNLKTIAILGCGLNRDYPRENWMLRKKIVEAGGMIISPFHADEDPLPGNFTKRNAIIAHFSKAVWVVEAAAISGTLNTVKHATAMERDIYVTPCFPDDPFFEGNQKLLSERETEKYSIVHPLFGTDSLQKTWSHLKPPPRKRRKIDRANLSRIQKLVLDLKHDYGECRINDLSARAMNQGMEAGAFFRAYIVELQEGRLTESRSGIVNLA